MEAALFTVAEARDAALQIARDEAERLVQSIEEVADGDDYAHEDIVVRVGSILHALGQAREKQAILDGELTLLSEWEAAR